MKYGWLVVWVVLCSWCTAMA
ncbi:MAG: hypothetical protein RL509_2193, partial [Pseudomonadota bacterium]